MYRNVRDSTLNIAVIMFFCPALEADHLLSESSSRLLRHASLFVVIFLAVDYILS